MKVIIEGAAVQPQFSGDGERERRRMYNDGKADRFFLGNIVVDSNISTLVACGFELGLFYIP